VQSLEIDTLLLSNDHQQSLSSPNNNIIHH